MVLQMLLGSQSFSPARHNSLIRSPAWVPTMAPPMMRWAPSSRTSLVMLAVSAYLGVKLAKHFALRWIFH